MHHFGCLELLASAEVCLTNFSISPKPILGTRFAGAFSKISRVYHITLGVLFFSLLIVSQLCSFVTARQLCY
jgi:hypothetical protein